jgi:hypothetical protein
MNETKKLPNDIVAAVAMYYANRGLQYDIEYITLKNGLLLQVASVSKQRKWDKEADLKRLDKACLKHKIGFKASAGTFWFYPKHPTNLAYEINENTFPLATILKDKGL